MAPSGMVKPSQNLFRFLQPYWLWVVLAPLCMAAEVALDLQQPRLLQTIIDQGIARSDSNFVIHTCLLMLGLAFLGVWAGVGCGFFSVLASQGFGGDLRGALFRKVQTLSFGNLDQLQTGALITRLTNDVSQVQDLVMMMLRMMVRAPLLLVGSLIMAVLTSPKLALLFFGLIPLSLTALILIIRRTYPMFGEVQRRLDALNTVMQENLAGVRTVKAFARAAHELGRFTGTNDRLMDQNVRAARLSSLTLPVTTLTLNLGVVAALWFGGVSVRAGELQVGQVIAFLNYLQQTLMALMFVSMLVVQISRAMASAQRVQEIFDTVPQVPEPVDGGSPLPKPQGRVAFENVTFHYDGAVSDPVLKNVSLVVEPGQIVAVLGATGSGKSSLVQLIPRFYDVSSGRVTLDGIDVRELDEDSLRRHVVIALQESILFSGTLRDNIRYGKPEATEEEVVEAAQIAQADEFIRRLPDGYNAIVGQRGVNLSGGQKQRIAIARAVMTRPTVLILDDSTSAVDVRTEARIQEALAAQPFRQTRLIVAQRISSVLNADRILILDRGTIVDEGTHEELLKTSPIYQEIYASQQEQGTLQQ